MSLDLAQRSAIVGGVGGTLGELRIPGSATMGRLSGTLAAASCGGSLLLGELRHPWLPLASARPQSRPMVADPCAGNTLSHSSVPLSRPMVADPDIRR